MKTIFEKIRDKEIPSYMVYEDDFVMAFLDISQATKGHTLVVSKEAFQDALETPDEVLSRMFVVAKKIAKALKQSLKPKGFNFLSNVGEVAGQTVFHVNLLIIPRYESNDVTLAFLPNIEDDFRQYTLLNGLTLRKGGSHVNHILYNVVARLRDKLSKKYKDIKPGDIRNKLFFVSVFNKFPNAKWDGQTKEELANSASDITAYLGNIDYDKIVAKILKTPAIIDAITEIYRIKEEFKKLKER